MSSIYSVNNSISRFNSVRGDNTQGQNGFMSRFANNIEEKNPYKNKVRQDMRNLIRGLSKKQENTANTFTATMIGKESGYLQTTSQSSSKNKEKSDLLMSSYKYKDVSAKIQRAKTSVSAGQALISAKRTVIDIKRKLGSGKGDAKELIAALSHAKRMEMVARKKKHNLEMEEMVEKNIDSEESKEKYEESSDDARIMVTSQAEEEIAEKEDEIFEERAQMLEEAMDDMDESMERMEEIAEFGEEELELLEETMEMYEELEVVDPHMSEEDYKEMVSRHRNSEKKAMVKADMDYLKTMFKMYMDKGSSLPAPSGINSEPISMGVDVVV